MSLIRLTFLLLLVSFHYTWAESVSIPLKTVKKPAADLLDSSSDRSGRVLEVGEASGRAQQGQDLSLLNPMDNKIWQNASYAVSDASERGYPQGINGVKWVHPEASYSESYMSMYMARVESLEKPGQFYRLTLSRATHAALLRAALLRKLGYFIPSPKFYKDLKLKFDSEAAKEEFLNKSQQEMGTDFDSRKWVTNNNKEEHSLTFSNAVLEPATSEYFDIAWGFAPPAKDPSRIPLIQRLSRYRAYRALVLAYVLADIPESVNRFSAKSASILGGNVVMTHPFADSFAAVTQEDARWLLRKIAFLNEKDLKNILAESHLPNSLQELVLAKLKYRMKNMFELFGMPELFRLNLPSLKINSPDGVVVDGKVKQEFISGYPQRFAHGDRPSPYNEEDIQKYLNIEAKSGLIKSVVDKINEKMNILSIGDLADQHKQDVIKKIMNHIQEHPDQPLYQEVNTWGGPVAGISLKGTRHVSTGTYFDSGAAVQLVDNFSVGGSLGYFLSIDGLENQMPVFGSNINIVRDYTHVRPINAMKEATKEAWANLLIPKFMKNLSAVLDKDDLIKDPNSQEPPMHPLDKFLGELKEGEVFTVTDSIALSTYAQTSSSLDVLMGLSPLSFLNSVSLGADASRVVLAQTQITKTRDGFQIFVRKQHSKIFGAQFDLNYFINLIRIRSQLNATKINTQAFIIDYDPSYISNLDLKDEKNKRYLDLRTNLKLALKPLFRHNNNELLVSKFKEKQFQVEHDLSTQSTQAKLLLLKNSNFSESHLLKITPPANPNYPDLNPKDAAITLFSYKKGQLVGQDLLGLIFDTINGIFQNKKSSISLDRMDQLNPANMPYGKAYWRIVTTESDLTNEKPKFPISARIQHVWGGWSLKQNKFFDLIDQIENELKETNLASYRLIEKEAFQNVKSIDFYRVTQQLSLLESGVYRLRDLILQPDADGKPVEKAKFLGRLFQKLSGGPARANDKEMLDDLMTIIGNGDFKSGVASYLSACKDLRKTNGENNDPYTVEWYKGSVYECLTPWARDLIKLSRSFPSKDRKAQTQWATEVLATLDQYIPMPKLLKYLGEENFIFFVRVNGFRSGDEDGDLEFFSNTIGRPPNNFDYSNGLINYWANKTRISPIELDRSNGGFQ